MNKGIAPSRLRNIGIIAHIDAGKTTTTERFLYYAGVSHQIGEIDEGTTQMDWMEEEKERGITITSAATRLSWKDHEINLIDTPGHVDFTAEVERALRVLDGAVVVLCGVGGVEPQSEMVWHQASRYKVPRILFVNKMDRLGANFEAVLDDVRATLGITPIVTHFPVGTEAEFRGVVDVVRGVYLEWDEASKGVQMTEGPIPQDEQSRYDHYRHELLECVAGEDEELLAAFVEGREIDPESIKRVLRKGTLARTIYPVLSGASLRNRGIQPLLDAVIDYLPAPTELAPQVAVEVDTGETVTRAPKNSEPLLGLVFKTYTERDRGRTSYIRIYSGKLSEGATVRVPRLKENERIARLFRVHADKRRNLKDAGAGDIVAVTGLKRAATGDTLTGGEDVLLEGIVFPEPVVSAALEPKSTSEEEKLQTALGKLAGDDPTFRVRIDENTGQTLISGMGELHLEVLEHRLTREFNVGVRIGKPMVTYRETVTETVRSAAEYDRFTAGTENFAKVELELSPLPRGEGFRFVSKVAAERIPDSIVRIIEAACVDARESGIQYGFPVVDLSVTLVEGEWNELRSSELAFRNATMDAFRSGCRKAGPILLEPIMSLEIVTPKDFLGGVMNSLAARHGRILNNQPRDLTQVLTAEAPLSGMFGYATDLRSASQGRATYSMLFARFDQVAGKGPFEG